MTRHMTLHEDVIERVLNILKQDDYYRTLEDLPVIDELMAYDDIKLFPELYDTSTIIERVTAEADLIEQQLKRPGMYPQHTDLSQNTPNLPKTNTQPASSDNIRNPSPQSSLQCGQRTPAASTSSSDAPSTPTQHTSPNPQKQHTPSKTNINPSLQSFITGDHKRVPKSADGTRVKRSKQQHRQPDEHLCFHCNLPGHLKRYCPKIPYCSICRTKGHMQDRCMNRQNTRHTHPAGETRDQHKRKNDLPQSSSHINMCLQCGGDHHTTNCTQRQSPSINASTTGTGIPPHQHAPNNLCTSVNNSQAPTTQTESTLHVCTPTLNINASPFPPNLHQAPLPPHANRPTNFHTNQPTHTPSHTFNTQFPPPFNPHVPPPYFPQYPATTSPSVHSSDSSILLALQKQWEHQEKLDMERNQIKKEKEERKRMKEEREQRKEDRKQMEKCENQQRSRINKAFEKIPRFNGTNPSYCFNWLEQTEALVHEHQGQIYREELLLNCGTSMIKTIHALPQGVTNQIIKDAVLRNHSNLRTVSQRSNAYQQLHQKPDEALQSYNTRYASFFHLAYPELELDNPLSRMHCIHYASSLYGKLGDEMTGRFNQDLPENLQMAFEKATNFEPRIIMKQSINSRKIHEINQIDIGQEDEIKINDAHVRNPNYKGKNYDPNFAQNRLKNNSSTNNSSNTYNNNTKSHYESSNKHNNTNSGYGHSKPHQQEKPVNVSVTLHGPVSKDQLYKIQEVLRHPSQYRDRIKPEDCPAKGEYATVFNKFCPKKVEVNEATVEEAIKYAQFLRKSEEDIVEAIDIYKALGNKTFYGPEESPEDQQDQPQQ